MNSKTETHSLKQLTLKSAPPVAFAILTVALIIGAVQMNWSILSFSESPEIISEARSFKNLAPRTPVVTDVDIEAGRYESLLVKTVYTELKLYADDVLIYECGQEGTYPEWLLDPPTLLRIVPLPKGASHLRFEYTSPSQRTTMSVPALTAGSESVMLRRLIIENSALLICSLFFLLIGLAITTITLLFWRGEKGFLHFGLATLAAGFWVFGECDATACLIPYPAALYIIAFTGFCTITIPLLLCGLFILTPRNPMPMPMRLCAYLTGAAVIIGFACQFAGIAALSKTLPVFQFLGLSGLAVFTATVIWERFRHKNVIAKQFTIPSLILAVATAVEFANWNLRFTHILNPFFLAGAFLYIVWMAFIGARHIVLFREEYRLAQIRNDEILRLVEIQQKHYKQLAGQIDLNRRINHDLGQFRTMLYGALRQDGAEKTKELLERIDGAYKDMQVQTYCDNMEIDALISYANENCKKRGIEFIHSVRLPDTLSIPVHDICVVIGNLLDNAIEAAAKCEDRRVVEITAAVYNSNLVVKVENTYTGKLITEGDTFKSTKDNPDQHGLGISIVKKIAETTGGELLLGVTGSTFTASVTWEVEYV